jgi:hypothetical protein
MQTEDSLFFVETRDGWMNRHWTEDDGHMSSAIDALTIVIERHDAESRRARLLSAARELVLMAAMDEERT